MKISVELFTEEELCNQLRLSLQSYRAFHLEGIEEIEEEKMDNEDMRDIESRAKLAADTFDAMFRGHSSGYETLLEVNESAALETLTERMRQSRPSGQTIEHPDLSHEECSRLLMNLSSESPSREQPALWPYIKVIRYVSYSPMHPRCQLLTPRVYLNAHILRAGLALVDLPGILRGSHISFT